MTTQLAAPRTFVITTRPSASATAVTNTTSVSKATPAATTAVQVVNSANIIANVATKIPTATAVLRNRNIKIEKIAIENDTASTSSDVEHEFEFIDDESVVAAANLEDVMTQEKLSNDDDQSEEISVISVVMPMDGDTESGNEANMSMSSLNSIKNNVDLGQHVTVVQAQGSDSDEGTPQYITVTVSAQDAGQNYQVQYVDTELYHSNSSQTQMTYPFCPVGDYQTNGQTYYSTANYATATASSTPTTHASTSLPYIVPVDDSLLLNSSSQSHSRDSPHSLTEVTYIQETQSTPHTPTSTTTTNSVSGGSIGGGASPESEQNPLGTTNKIATATVKWLSCNYETADGVSLPRSTLYNHYMLHCNENKLEPVNAASFGKLIRSVFSGLRTRRLGTRGNSKYHYYGIRIKADSILNQAMDEKPSIYTSQGGGNSGAGLSSGVSSSNNAGGSNTHRSKKLSLKTEFEACAQYLGEGVGAMPTFPEIELNHTFSSELTQDDVETFRSMYREHCESFLDAVLTLEFGTIEFLWRDFWRASDNGMGDDCDDEKYLNKTKLYLLCHCAEVQKFTRDVDYHFYQNLVDVIIPDVLRCIPNALTQAIRNFAKNLELWLCESMVGVPERMIQIKSSAVSAFCQTLRRYTSLNHLAQAARAVLNNPDQIRQMAADLNRVDFHNVQEQAAWVCQCDTVVVQRLENEFKVTLQQQSSLEQWATWMQLVVDTTLQEYRGKPNFAKAARQFLLKWSFYSSMVIRDLTLRSAASFGSFHLIRLLYDEYMFYLVEHKIAEAQQKTAIAVICDRMGFVHLQQKDVDFDFEYQLEFINESSESATSVPAKRMKHE